MCGVSGKDLVSIGGYIDRQRVSERYRAAQARVNEYIEQGTICPIGADRKDQVVNRFKYKGINGNYNFDTDGWSHWSATSTKTKVKKRVTVTSRDWPSHVNWTKRQFYDLVLDLAEGNIQLNF